jgi:hypothetical protein
MSDLIANYGDTDPFPLFKKLWSLYSKKGAKTVFVSIGSKLSCMADLEIAETLGCPLHVVALSPTEERNWEEVRSALLTHERGSDFSEFSKGSNTKWVLSRNLLSYTTVPWWGEGVLNGLVTVPVSRWTEELCLKMRLDEIRIDILKLDMPDGLERGLLGAILDSGLRPGCIVVSWEYLPNNHIPTTLTAGHLQNCGYQLVSMLDKKFFYYYIDQDMYMTCSWETTKYTNPLVYEIISNYASKVSANGTNSRVQTRDAPGAENSDLETRDNSGAEIPDLD